MKILCLSPHTDDCELSAGATMAKFSRIGHHVISVALSDCDSDDLSKEFRRSTTILGSDSEIIPFNRRQFPQERQSILNALINLNTRINPDIVLTPSSLQRHQDHQVVHEESIRAFRCRIYGYEQPWNSLHQNLTAFNQVSPDDLTSKLNALGQYTSQAARPYFDVDFITSWATMRGVQFGVPLAEAFEVIRTQVL